MEEKIIRLQSCTKGYTHDQDKACSPEETVARFQERLKACNLDVLKEIQRIDNGRLDIPVYFSVCGEDARTVIGNKKQMGKGSTPEQSRASACMELGERFSFFSFLQNPDNFLIGDYAQMKAAGYPVLALEVLLQSVHDSSLSPDVLGDLLNDLPMRWTWATRIRDEKLVLVPFSWFYAINEFNGPAAGNTYEEAMVQGISEVVERHVCALISREDRMTPAIDLDSVDDPVALTLLEKFFSHGIELFINDFSLDTGIPTIGVVAWDPATFPEKSEIVYTAGTTPDPNKALIRALTEVAQLAGDFNTESNYVASGLPKPTSLADVASLLTPEKKVALDTLPAVHSPDIYQEVQNCLAALQAIDMEVYAVDVMHPDLQIPAIYTIVPGAHFRERAMGGNAALFAAKLAADLLPSEQLMAKLAQMEEILPDAYYLEFYMGRTLYEQGDITGALMQFDQALSHSPNDEDLPYLYSYKGCCLRDLELWSEAILALEQGLSHDEERPDMHNILGVCHFKRQEYSQAVEHFRRAVALNPVSAIDYANLALNLEKSGQTAEAAEQYQVALSLDSSIAFAVEGLARLVVHDDDQARRSDL